MKMKLSLLSAVLVLGLGCASEAKFVAAMAKDPATSHLRVTTMWGSLEYSRTVPGTNQIDRVFAPAPPTAPPPFEFKP